MFSNPIDRRRTVCAVLAVNTQAASGAMYMIALVYRLFTLLRRDSGPRIYAVFLVILDDCWLTIGAGL